MSYKNFKLSFYKKILIKSSGSHIRINCENEPEFLYDMKDVGVCLSTNDYDINNFINVVDMKYWNNERKIISLECGEKNSYFTLRPDFSNIFEFLDKFSTLIRSMSKFFEWKHLFFEIDYTLNYIKYDERNFPKLVYIYVRSDFEDFDILEKYDFIISEKTSRRSNNKITFDGELLESDKYIIRFINKPRFNKFTVDLDVKINSISFEIPRSYHTSELISRYIPKSRKYNIQFRPANIEFFLYLKALNNVGWFDKGVNIYTETDLLTKMYNI